MPNHKATEKSLRQNVKRHANNAAEKSKIRTLVKKVRAAVSEKNFDAAKEQLKAAVSALDTAAKKHVIHPKNAARRKSRLMTMINKAQSD
ncbi:MAG: 30S ribosomal protein S20 [Candidatus Omnitrophica bacterium]|nr:30S ribosomal protein S20 [Candidatus Omnitrophota bacterium]